MAKNKELFEVIYKSASTNPTVSSKYAPYEIPFYKTEDELGSLEAFVEFVKDVEKMVRQSPYYKKYVNYIHDTVGLNRCQVLGNITKEMAPMEVHHGPMLTLFDITCIVVDSLLSKHKAISEFDVAYIIMDEHRRNNVQLINVSETVHEQLHDFGGPFISVDQAFGNFNEFIRRYQDGIKLPEIQKINKYIQMSKEFDSFDKDYLN